MAKKKKTKNRRPMKEEDVVREQAQANIDRALADENVRSIYFNGFSNAMGAGDVLTVLMQNNKPVAVLNGSYTTIKTLAIKLGNLIAELEEKTGNRIMTIDDIQAKFSAEKHDDKSK